MVSKQKDVDATWTKKHGKSYFGFKVTANTDNRYKIIRKIKVTTASSHDTNHLEDVLDDSNTSKDLYADKGYADKAREARLKKAGIRPHIQHKAKKGKPISTCQKKRNHTIGSLEKQAFFHTNICNFKFFIQTESDPLFERRISPAKG